jgi:hypothetical protein
MTSLASIGAASLRDAATIGLLPATIVRHRPSPPRVRQYAECCAQDAFRARVTHVGLAAHVFERPACFSLAKAKCAQRAKRLRVCFGDAGIYDRAIRSAVRMTDHETGRHAAFEDELPAVLGTVMRGAEDHEGVRVVIAALGAKLHVVQIKEHPVSTTWNDAPAAVAPHDLATHGRRHVLSCPRRSRRHRRRGPAVATGAKTHVSMGLLFLGRITHVNRITHVGRITHVARGRRRDATQMLRVAAGHLHNFRAHGYGFAVALLPTAAAFLADRERDLIVRAARVAGATKHMPRHEQKPCVVIDGTARLAAKLHHRFSKGRERLRRDLEPQDVRRGRPIPWRIRPITEVVSRNELFDLAQTSPFCDREPLVLVLRHGHAGQFPHRRPIERPVSQGLVEFGEPLERFSHPQALGGPARGISEEPFDVFGEGGEANLKVRAGSESGNQGAAFLPIEVSAAFREPRQLVVRTPPVERLLM